MQIYAIRFFQGIAESSTFVGTHYILGSYASSLHRLFPDYVGLTWIQLAGINLGNLASDQAFSHLPVSLARCKQFSDATDRYRTIVTVHRFSGVLQAAVYT